MTQQEQQFVNELQAKINTLETELAKANKKLKELKKVLQNAVRTIGQ